MYDVIISKSIIIKYHCIPCIRDVGGCVCVSPNIRFCSKLKLTQVYDAFIAYRFELLEENMPDLTTYFYDLHDLLYCVRSIMCYLTLELRFNICF